VDDANAVDSPEEPTSAHLPPQQNRPGMPQGHMPPGYMPNVGMDPQQALAYGYVQPQRGSQYMPPSGLQQHAGHQS
jgi:MADS-box transcription factor